MRMTQSNRVIDLNLPVSGVAALLVVIFLRLRTPEGSMREKLARMDWLLVTISVSIL